MHTLQKDLKEAQKGFSVKDLQGLLLKDLKDLALENPKGLLLKDPKGLVMKNLLLKIKIVQKDFLIRELYTFGNLFAIKKSRLLSPQKSQLSKL